LHLCHSHCPAWHILAGCYILAAAHKPLDQVGEKNKREKRLPSFATGRSFVIALTLRHSLPSTVNLK